MAPDVALGNALIVIGMVAYTYYLLNSRDLIWSRRVRGPGSTAAGVRR